MRSLGCIIKLNEELLVHLVVILLRRALKIHNFESMLLEREQSFFFINIWCSSTRENYLTYILGGFDVEKQSISVELINTTGVEKAALVSVLSRLIIANFPIHIAREFTQKVLELDSSNLTECLQDYVENRNQRYQTKNHAQSRVQIKVPAVQRWVIFQLIEALHLKLRQVAAHPLHLAASLLLIRVWLLNNVSLFDKLATVEPLFLKNIIEQFLEGIRVVVD